MQNAQKNACNLKKFQYNKGEKPNRTSTDIFWKEGELMYKKRFLRLVSAVLALCMMAALLPTAAFAADPEPKPTPAGKLVTISPTISMIEIHLVNPFLLSILLSPLSFLVIHEQSKTI